MAVMKGVLRGALWVLPGACLLMPDAQVPAVALRLRSRSWAGSEGSRLDDVQAAGLHFVHLHRIGVVGLDKNAPFSTDCSLRQRSLP